ncbi:hypothetical protein OAG77_01110, partial [bacterium]|nr:hypothetical protein [bacterium]
ALFLLKVGGAFAAMVIPPVTFDSDTVGAQSANPNLVHSSMVDWQVATDSILDPVPAENVYQSTNGQTNLKVAFPTVTLAVGESLRVKVDYRYLAQPNDPGMQPYNFLRFGAYDTHGTTTFTDDQGYLADVSYWESAMTSGSTTKNGDYSIRREDNVWDDFDLGPLLDNDMSPVNWTPPAVPETGDIRTMARPDGSMATWAKASDEGTSSDHAAVICITNNGNEVEVCLFHGFPAVMVGRAVDRSGGGIVNFDAIYLESPSDNSGFNIDNIGIQHLPQGMGCCGDCFEFEDLTLGDSYNVGDMFVTYNMSGTTALDVEAVPFVWADGTIFSGGVARVENGGNAGHGGNEFNVNNIGLRFSSASGPVPGFSVLFGEYGGNLNFSINGDFRNFANFQDINGSVIGGAVVFVSGGNGNDQGQLVAFGSINEFSIGGQELYIDHICPEMNEGGDNPDQPDNPDGSDDPDDPDAQWGSISGHKFQGGEEASNNLYGPFGLAFSDTGMLYVANEGRGGGGWHVSIVNPAGEVDTFSLGFNGPSGVAFNSSGELYISDDSNRVFILDPLGSVTVFIDETAGLSNPNAIAFDSTDHLYTVSSGGFVSRFFPDGTFDKLLADGLSNPESVVVDESIGMLFVSDVDGKIWQMEMDPTAPNMTTGTLYADTGAFTEGGLSQDSAGNLYLSAYGEGSVYRIELDGTVAEIATGISQARGSTIGPDGKLYVTSYDADEVHRIDLTSFAVEFYAPTAVLGTPPGPGGGGLPGWLIYLDQNRNGTFDSGELSTVTDGSGYYEFLGLGPDTYYVAEEMVVGWIQVVPGAPDYDYTVFLGPGDHVTDVDFVNIPEADEDCLEWYRGNDPGAVSVVGTLSEQKAIDFDLALSIIPGEHGLIDFEGFSIGDFTTKVLDTNVTAALPNTGDAVSVNQPGIADQTTASSGLGYNTTAGGDKHLQVLPLNDGPDGGVVLAFSRPAKALGFYLVGLEETKREVWAFIEFTDGSNQAVLTDVGLNPGGGIQFFGFIAENCPIKSFSLIELYDADDAGRRDIFGIDDIRYIVDDTVSATEDEFTEEDLDQLFNNGGEGNEGNHSDPTHENSPSLESDNPAEHGPAPQDPADQGPGQGKPGEHGPAPHDPTEQGPGQDKPGEHGEIRDNDVVDEISFANKTNIAFEDWPGNSKVLIQRTGGSGRVTVWVTPRGLDLGAQAGLDFDESPIEVIFPTGELTQTVTIPIVNDDEAEDSESLYLELSLGDNAPEGAVLGRESTTLLVILSDPRDKEELLMGPSDLRIQLKGQNVVFSWEGKGALQTATSLQGPYTNLPGEVTSPYTWEATGDFRFFRVIP